MFRLFDGYSTTIDKINRKTDEATNKIMKASGYTDKFNNKLQATGASASTASSGLGRFISIAAMVAGAVKGMNISDEYTNTAARLNLINDGLQTQAQLQNKIFAAAYRSKGAYSSMADAVAKLELNAGDQFKSNDEAIAFTELLQKSFKIGGASKTEQSSAMLQLTQAIGSGKLQGDEFRSIMENAPLVASAIAKYMHKSKGELKNLSSQGVITSDIIKNAMFASADEINKKFKKMPYTFADVWTKIKNGGTQAFSWLMKKINKMLNTAQGKQLVDDIIGGLYILADVIGNVVNFTISNWPTIKTILEVIAGVYLAIMISKLWQSVTAIIAQGAAWVSVYWPILLVIAAIGLAIYAARQFGATWEDICGAAGGSIFTLGAYFGNKFAYMWNTTAAFANFFGNVFNSPVASIKALFLDMVITVMGYINTMAMAIEDTLNKIPGVKINSATEVQAQIDKLAAKTSEMKSKYNLKTYVKTKDYIDYSTAYKVGDKKGRDVVDQTSKLFNNVQSLMNKMNSYSGKPIKVEGTGSDGKIKVDMSDEDLKYLRDIAERDYINKFSTATLAPKIKISFGDVHENADINKLKGTLEMMMREEIAIAAEGAY